MGGSLICPGLTDTELAVTLNPSPPVHACPSARLHPGAEALHSARFFPFADDPGNACKAARDLGITTNLVLQPSPLALVVGLTDARRARGAVPPITARTSGDLTLTGCLLERGQIRGIDVGPGAGNEGAGSWRKGRPWRWPGHRAAGPRPTWRWRLGKRGARNPEAACGARRAKGRRPVTRRLRPCSMVHACGPTPDMPGGMSVECHPCGLDSGLPS